jgi:hypothetical protein
MRKIDYIKRYFVFVLSLSVFLLSHELNLAKQLVLLFLRVGPKIGLAALVHACRGADGTMFPQFHGQAGCTVKIAFTDDGVDHMLAWRRGKIFQKKKRIRNQSSCVCRRATTFRSLTVQERKNKQHSWPIQLEFI